MFFLLSRTSFNYIYINNCGAVFILKSDSSFGGARGFCFVLEYGKTGRYNVHVITVAYCLFLFRHLDGEYTM